MRKFIHSNFELDLSAYKITDTTENPWITGRFFAKYSFPFEVALTDENDIAFGLISHHNSMSAETVYEGMYVHGNTMERAVLEIEECGKVLSVTLRYGFEEFPSFDVKLSALPLIDINVPNIYTHAAGIVSQTWPAVKYNFPQVHTDRFDPETDMIWSAFEKTINNYRDGAFLINEVDVDEELSFNRNIIQPLPYLLYLLQAGVEHAGFILKGEILEDPDFIKTVVYSDLEYFKRLSTDTLQIIAMSDEYDTKVPAPAQYPYLTSWQEEFTMEKTLEITQPGRYRITGRIFCRALDGFFSTSISYNSAYLGYVYETDGVWEQFYTTYFEDIDWNVDLEFETDAAAASHIIKVKCNGAYAQDDVVIDLSVEPVILFNDAGIATPSIINENKVNLKKAVPDILFGDLMKAVIATKNYNMEPRGNELWMNLIKNDIETKPVLDLSEYEVKFPKRKFNKGNSFLMKYQDVESEDYEFAEVFQNRDGVVTQGYVTNEKTAEIIINALPLPLKINNGVQSAHAFLQENAKPFFVIYNGLNNGVNASQDPSQLFIPALHENYHREWMASRINSTTYTWNFVTNYERLLALNAKSRVFAYANKHLIKSIQKAEVSPDLFEVEIETELHI